MESDAGSALSYDKQDGYFEPARAHHAMEGAVSPSTTAPISTPVEFADSNHATLPSSNEERADQTQTDTDTNKQQASSDSSALISQLSKEANGGPE
jgi:hypothetical protein